MYVVIEKFHKMFFYVSKYIMNSFDCYIQITVEINGNSLWQNKYISKYMYVVIDNSIKKTISIYHKIVVYQVAAIQISIAHGIHAQ